jgi:hypothetical protein
MVTLFLKPLMYKRFLSNMEPDWRGVGPVAIDWMGPNYSPPPPASFSGVDARERSPRCFPSASRDRLRQNLAKADALRRSPRQSRPFAAASVKSMLD